MPYKRQYKRYTKKNYSKKGKFHRYAGYANTAMSTATKALILAHGIKKLMNVEFKFHDVQFEGTESPRNEYLIFNLVNLT